MPSLTSYNEVGFYDPMIDDYAVRISGFSDAPGEWWIREARAPAGKARRLQRERALDLIRMAIEQGCEPGEVVAGN